MKRFWMSIFIGLLHTACMAQQSFDPERDTIALSDRLGHWHILVPEKTLIASAEIVSPLLSAVETVTIQDIHRRPYLFFKGRNRLDPTVGYTVMVLLEERAPGIWKAGDIFQTCWGTVCSRCGFDEYWGCACERYDGDPDQPAEIYCEHRIALGPGLAPVGPSSR